MLGNEEAKRLEADRLHLLDENSTLRRLLARSQSENKSLLSTCLAQRSSLEEAVRHLELATSSTTAAAAAALASATERNAALESELGEVRGERDEAVRMVEEMRGMWTKERREWEELMVGKVGEVEREKTAAERALRKKLQERDREVVVLRRRATDLENEVRRASDKADRARVLEDQLNALNAENQSLRDDIQHLRSSLDQYLLGRQSLLAENKALQSGLRHEQEESAQTKAHLESRIRNLEDAIDSLRGQSKEEEVNSKRTAMQAKGKYESLKKVAEGLKEESKKWKKVAEASQSAVDAMNGKLKDVQRTLESARETNGRLMERVEAAEMQRSKAEILESALAKVAAEKDAMSKVVAQLKMHASNVGSISGERVDMNRGFALTPCPVSSGAHSRSSTLYGPESEKLRQQQRGAPDGSVPLRGSPYSSLLPSNSIAPSPPHHHLHNQQQRHDTSRPSSSTTATPPPKREQDTFLLEEAVRSEQVVCTFSNQISELEMVLENIAQLDLSRNEASLLIMS